VILGTPRHGIRSGPISSGTMQNQAHIAYKPTSPRSKLGKLLTLAAAIIILPSWPAQSRISQPAELIGGLLSEQSPITNAIPMIYTRSITINVIIGVDKNGLKFSREKEYRLRMATMGSSGVVAY